MIKKALEIKYSYFRHHGLKKQSKKIIVDENNHSWFSWRWVDIGPFCTGLSKKYIFNRVDSPGNHPQSFVHNFTKLEHTITKVDSLKKHLLLI